MTEKRYSYDGVIIIDHLKKDLIHIDGKDELLELAEYVDKLQEENEQLKQQIGNLEHTRDFCAECCERLEKENEELKSEIRKVQRAYEQLWEHTYK